jgi:hypothetical protein
LENEPQYLLDSFSVQFFVSKIVNGKKESEILITMPRGWYPADLGPVLDGVVEQAKLRSAEVTPA